MAGFLGTRGDFFSDLLILALALVVPALVFGVILGRRRRVAAHRLLMTALVAVLVLYVVVYEANLMLRGGVGYLRSVTSLPPGTYFTTVAIHVAIGCAALLVAVWAVRRGRARQRSPEQQPPHARLGWAGVVLLGLSSVTGVVVYWATFVR